MQIPVLDGLVVQPVRGQSWDGRVEQDPHHYDGNLLAECAHHRLLH